jgi:hypothetical protein
MTTPRAAALGGKSSEGAPLLSSRPGVAPHGRGHRPGMRFLGLLLWQWGLVLLGAVLLYLLYIVGASFAWRKGGKRYHVVMITLGCISGVRARAVGSRGSEAGPQPRRLRRVSARTAHTPPRYAGLVSGQHMHPHLVSHLHGAERGRAGAAPRAEECGCRTRGCLMCLFDVVCSAWIGTRAAAARARPDVDYCK